MKYKQEIIRKLQELDKKLDALIENRKSILTLPEAADYLGLSKNYLYKLTSKNLIFYSKPLGKRIFFQRELLDKWALRNSNKSEDDLHKLADNHLVKQKKRLIIKRMKN